MLDGVEAGIVVVDGDHRVTRANERAAGLLGLDRDGLVGADIRETFPESVDAGFEELTAAAPAEEYFPGLGRWLSVRTREVPAGTAVYLRDVSDRRAYERRLADRADYLATLRDVLGLVGDLVDQLTGAATREDVERTVCERLTATDRYDLAWVAQRDGDGGLRECVTSGDGSLCRHLVDGDTDPTGAPERAALDRGEAVAVEGLGEADRVPEAVRRVAFERGLTAVLAAPLAHGETTYGVLAVYAGREEAFAAGERTGFEGLADLVGFAIAATRQRNLLGSDAVQELTLRVTEPTPLTRVADAADATLSLRGTVPLAAGRLLAFFEVGAGDPATVRERLVAADGVEGATRLDTNGDALVEATLADAGTVPALADLGLEVREATVEAGGVELVADAPAGCAVREVVEEVRTRFASTTLVAKRRRDRPRGADENGPRAELTDRQHQVLRTAYFAGYFESPRAATAEEVADALDISSATLHHHLRAAERAVVGRFLD